jgi:hypothetical protein
VVCSYVQTRFLLFLKMLPPYNLAGIDLMTRSSSLLGGRRRRCHLTTPPPVDIQLVEIVPNVSCCNRVARFFLCNKPTRVKTYQNNYKNTTLSINTYICRKALKISKNTYTKNFLPNAFHNIPKLAFLYRLATLCYKASAWHLHQGNR